MKEKSLALESEQNKRSHRLYLLTSVHAWKGLTHIKNQAKQKSIPSRDRKNNERKQMHKSP